ncbi:OmpA family protein [Paracrocinitomix mangrovi]|uniref:OmpA family protein n=1 Tax=Paracrocinitomix mangrovi TaxID=2862509 RepID=UPI001C8DC278|nr:OmpA family protein [Paracrocinitomix mangrovi]UKN02632.1 OmpA family protein [Paracrocinitomix mangrovi]
MARILLSIVVLMIFGFGVNGQESARKSLMQAEKFHKRNDFSPALKAYKEVLSLEPNNKKALKGIVDIYLNVYQVYDSAAMYIDRQLTNIEEDTNYLIYYNKANVLRFQEQHEEAIKTYNFFKEYGIKKYTLTSEIEQDVDKSIRYCLNAMNNQETIYEPYKVENMDFFINSIESEYTPVYLDDMGILLYNARYKDYDSERRDADNMFFENIYYFDLEESVASTFNPSIEQTTHQCVVGKVFGTDSVLVFYQNKIWISTMSEDRLNNLKPLPAEFGSYYFQPHGVFSRDMKTFIFSARSETGNLDLYISENKSGTWSNPKPISFRINSEEDEDAPFLTPDGKTLYFSSKGHNSSGGYDFFYSVREGNDWSAPQNMGYPMNSTGDDIYISWNSNGRGGYFSSNRNGGFGMMDIYSFGLIKKSIEGVTMDKDSNILANVSVQMKNLDTEEIETFTSDENGKFSVLVDPENKFEFFGTKEGYFEDKSMVETFGEEEIFSTTLVLEKDPGLSLFLLVKDAKNQTPLDSVKIVILDNMIDKYKDSTITDISGSFNLPLPDKKLEDRGSYNITLTRPGYLAQTVTFNVLFDKEGRYNVFEDLDVKMEKVEIGNDLTKIIDLNPIYFDYNKAIIRPDAAIELDKIVQVMNDNPNMRIELGSHTDSRGSDKKNQSLSDRRAKASADYIKKRISNPDRITGKGYGESKLINHCSDGIDCSELEHQQNRRTEFIILEM